MTNTEETKVINSELIYNPKTGEILWGRKISMDRVFENVFENGEELKRRYNLGKFEAMIVDTDDRGGARYFVTELNDSRNKPVWDVRKEFDNDDHAIVYLLKNLETASCLNEPEEEKKNEGPQNEYYLDKEFLDKVGWYGINRIFGHPVHRHSKRRGR